MAFPIIAATNTTADTSGAAVTVSMPSGITAGNLLLVFVAHDTDASITQSGGSDWTRIANGANGTAVQGAVFAKIAAGGDSLELTDGAENNDMACVAVRITTHGVVSVSTDITLGTAATGADAAPNPPNCNPGVAKDYLWLEFAASDDDDNTATFWSSNYSTVAQVESASSTSSCLASVAQRSLNAASENPGVMALAAIEEWWAQTLAINPGLEILPSAIAATTTVPSPALKLYLLPSAIASGTTVPSPTVSSGEQVITATAIASTTTVPSPAVGYTVAPTAIAATTTVPSPALGMRLLAAAFGPSTTLELPQVNLKISVPAIASGTAIPTLTVGRGPVSVAPTAIAAGTSVPSPDVAVGTAYITPSAIGPLASVPGPGIVVYIHPVVIAAGTTVPDPTVVRGPVFALPPPIAATTSFPMHLIEGGSYVSHAGAIPCYLQDG